MKSEELRELSLEEITAREEELKTEIFNLKIQFATGKLENPMKLRSLGKDIARVKTIIRERNNKESAASQKK